MLKCKKRLRFFRCGASEIDFSIMIFWVFFFQIWQKEKKTKKSYSQQRLFITVFHLKISFFYLSNTWSGDLHSLQGRFKYFCHIYCINEETIFIFLFWNCTKTANKLFRRKKRKYHVQHSTFAYFFSCSVAFYFLLHWIFCFKICLRFFCLVSSAYNEIWKWSGKRFCCEKRMLGLNFKYISCIRSIFHSKIVRCVVAWNFILFFPFDWSRSMSIDGKNAINHFLFIVYDFFPHLLESDVKYR